MTYPLTVSMTPAFYYPGDWLFRAQLRCLSEQKCKYFDVFVIDPHYSKRKSYMPELAEHYKLNIVHIPYAPNTFVAKKLDCAVFNAAYCYSEAPSIVRYSCWRLVTPEFTDVCLGSDTNINFRFHSIEPHSSDAHELTGHKKDIWDMTSDEVHWDKVPRRSGENGATWGPDADCDEGQGLFRKNCYGNYMVFRDQWLGINGCDETFTNSAHYEDMEFCMRARNANMQCTQKHATMFRLHHWYGSYSGRANILPDTSFKPVCDKCEKALMTLEPRRYDIKSRLLLGEIELIEQLGVWVCKTCSLCGPAYGSDPAEHLDYCVRDRRIIHANIIPKYKLGRNLKILTEDMDGKSLEQKVEIYNNSWNNPKYYSYAT